MSWDDAFKLMTAFLTSLGGGTLLLFSLSTWLGKVWADRIARTEMKHLERDLEKAKRYSESQFRVYNELWGSLCDLRIAGDELWEQASTSKARQFARFLKVTSDQITRNSLLINDEDYTALRRLITRFSEFDTGKHRLIELRKSSISDYDVSEHQIQEVISQNRTAHEEYSRLLNEIEPKLRERIRGL